MQPRSMIRTGLALIGPARPIILYHKPTARCDCRCRFCDSWKQQPENEDVLPSTKVLSLLDRAFAAGMTTYTAWGGEPLLVEALPDWLRHARALGLQTVVCTSGYRLPDRGPELGPYTDRLLLSLEAVGERQDKLRGTPGLFDRILAGISEFKKRTRGEITLWSNLSRDNKDQVAEIAGLAREHAISVEFFPAALYPGYNEDIILDPGERDEVFGQAIDLKRRGYPVLNTGYALELMRTGRPFHCNLARLAVQVFPDGTLYPCEPRVIPELEPYGTAGEVDLTGLRYSEKYKEARERLRTCNRCLLPCVANMADSLLAQGLRRFLGQLYYRRSRSSGRGELSP